MEPAQTIASDILSLHTQMPDQPATNGLVTTDTHQTPPQVPPIVPPTPSFWQRLKAQHFVAILVLLAVIFGLVVRQVFAPVPQKLIAPIPCSAIVPPATVIATPSATVTPTSYRMIVPIASPSAKK